MNGDLFGLPVSVGAEPQHLAARRPLRQVIDLVPGDGRHVKTLHIRPASARLLTVAVQQVVGGAFIPPLPDPDVQDVLSKERLGADLGNLHGAILSEDNDVGDVRAITDVLPLSPRHADAHKSFVLVGVQFVVGHRHFGAVNVAKRPQDGLPFTALAVLLLELAVPLYGVIRQVLEVVLHLIHFHLKIGNALVGLVRVKLGNALDADLGESGHILVGHRTDQVLDVGRQAFMDGLQDGFPRFALFDVAVDALLDENLFERSKMPGFLQFAEADFKFPAKQHPRAVCAALQDLLNPEENGAIVLNHTGIGRNAHLTIGECKQCIDGAVR